MLTPTKITTQLFIWLFSLVAGNAVAQESVYDQLWNDPSVIKRIETDIEKYRKGDAVIKITNKKGKPLSKAKVTIQQQSHEFLFGCNLFALGQLKTPELNRKYETFFTNLFNSATVPFYWGDLEPDQGQKRFGEESPHVWRRPPPDELVKWCKEHHIEPKGHALMYAKNMFMPGWTIQNNPEAFLKQGHKHMAEIAKRYGDTFPIWDVANEEIPRIRHLEQWHKVPDDYLEWCFKEADNLFPKNVKMLYNDGTEEVHKNIDEYKALFNRLIKQKIRIDGMGIQFHIYNRPSMLEGKLYPPNELFNAYDQLSEMKLPLYITEITIPGKGDNGAVLQGKIVENLYRLWFSTPNMAGITWWNLGDGTAFEEENKAMGGLLDDEMNPKPAYEALDKLINHDWKTNETLSTDSNGNVNYRGFHGKYLIRISGNGINQEFTFELKSGNKPSRATFQIK
jgi:GH35 family endo-1,4-beta-xylanase